MGVFTPWKLADIANEGFVFLTGKQVVKCFPSMPSVQVVSREFLSDK